ncbi:MAG: ATP-grasp domain-containing protein [Aggregatilineaceae bacterium]
MARLHEYQSRELLAQVGIPAPRGGVASTAEEARRISAELGGPVVVKAQAWVTGRAALGAIRFAADPEAAAEAAAAILRLELGSYPVEQVLVVERLSIAREFYAGVIIDDQARAPVMIFSSRGGSGIEDIAREYPETVARHTVDIRLGLRDFEARELARRAGLHGELLVKIGSVLPRLYEAARRFDARAAEINPLALTEDGQLMAADCRFTIDDNAVFRQPELGITFARELDHPPTCLERIAWEVERGDYRGTFFFVQLAQGFTRGEGFVGFHGAGGGGSMMSMDALEAQGLRPANFVDTSGNPPASKVYRAARIILSQPGIDGYFASGSGVASQEQYHSARALVKAFLEAPLTVPAVVRLGGNAEEKAIAILRRAQPHLQAPLEAYGKDDPPTFCAARLRALIAQTPPPATAQTDYGPRPAATPYSFRTVTGGTVTLDHTRCRDCVSKVCISACVPQILALQGNVPMLNITHEEAERGGCVECLACEIECYFEGNQGGYVHLPIPGLDAVQHAGRGGDSWRS